MIEAIIQFFCFIMGIGEVLTFIPYLISAIVGINIIALLVLIIINIIKRDKYTLISSILLIITHISILLLSELNGDDLFNSNHYTIYSYLKGIIGYINIIIFLKFITRLFRKKEKK